MKKIKRVLAMIMAMAMVMGLSMTVSAADEAKITINNARSGKFVMVKVVEADSTKDTGWDFVDDYADEFLTAFGYTDGNADTDINRQTIIKGMIYAKDSTASEGEEIDDFAVKYAAALAKIAKPLEEKDAKPASELTVSDAGLYVIQGFETNYVYSPMAVFVGMDMTTGTPGGLLNPEEVNAKKQPTWTEKKVDDLDKITEIGRTLTYTVTSTVPYFADTEANKQYWVSDVILKGAEYVLDNGKLNVTVKVGDGTQYNKTHEVDVEKYVSTGSDDANYAGKDSFALDLTEELGVANNTYANQTIEVSYKAKVTDVLLHNDAMFGKGEHKSEFGKDSEKLVTAKVTFVKTGDNDVKLNNAVFVLTNGKEGNDLRYASFTTESSNPTEYKFARWLTETEAKKSGTNDFIESVKLTTGGTDSDNNALGTFTVSGLDYKENGDTTTKYKFVEIQAPDGYSINETNSTITWDPMTDEDEDGIPDNLDVELSGNATMADTKLANLPGTGGIGTTIFTIGGCAIMIAAAGLFFASRRKQENK